MAAVLRPSHRLKHLRIAEFSQMGSYWAVSYTHLDVYKRQLQEHVMRIRMMPVSSVFSRFPRMVHDISGKLGKQVELRINGEQTELDKTVIEEIGDPLVHLVRNSLDHGLEPPAERLEQGKPETGAIMLNACLLYTSRCV